MRFNLLRRAGHGTPEVDTTDLARLQRDAVGVQVVDVREPDEWAGGRIPGAIHVPLGELGLRKGELDPARPVVAVCRSGRRSVTAADALRGAGFADVASLAGGMNAWRESGLPVDR